MDEISLENSRKLDRIVQLLEGEGDSSPGLLARVSSLEVLMFGKDHSSGLIHKVSVMWRFYVWLLCTLSATVGFLMRELVRVVWGV